MFRVARGLVEQVFPDKEGVVRRVIVRTADGIYQRDVRKLCLLEERLLSCIEQDKERMDVEHYMNC